MTFLKVRLLWTDCLTDSWHAGLSKTLAAATLQRTCWTRQLDAWTDLPAGLLAVQQVSRSWPGFRCPVSLAWSTIDPCSWASKRGVSTSARTTVMVSILIIMSWASSARELRVAHHVTVGTVLPLIILFNVGHHWSDVGSVLIVRGRFSWVGLSFLFVSGQRKLQSVFNTGRSIHGNGDSAGLGPFRRRALSNSTLVS